MDKASLVYFAIVMPFSKTQKIPTDLGFVPKGKRPGRLISYNIEALSMDIKPYSDIRDLGLGYD